MDWTLETFKNSTLQPIVRSRLDIICRAENSQLSVPSKMEINDGKYANFTPFKTENNTKIKEILL